MNIFVDTNVLLDVMLRRKDFEDAVQFISAQEINADFIITRNKSDFESLDIPCLSPSEYIAKFKSDN